MSLSLIYQRLPQFCGAAFDLEEQRHYVWQQENMVLIEGKSSEVFSNKLWGSRQTPTGLDPFDQGRWHFRPDFNKRVRTFGVHYSLGGLWR